MAKKVNIKKLVKEELDKQLNEGDYYIDSLQDFINKNDTSSPYKPTIKLFGEKHDTKHLSVDWEFIQHMIDYLKETPMKEAVTSPNKMETVNLTDGEIGLVVSLYNKYSGEGPVADKKNYQYIQPDYAAEVLEKYINDTNASPNGKLLAKNVLRKFQGK